MEEVVFSIFYNSQGDLEICCIVLHKSTSSRQYDTKAIEKIEETRKKNIILKILFRKSLKKALDGYITGGKSSV